MSARDEIKSDDIEGFKDFIPDERNEATGQRFLVQQNARIRRTIAKGSIVADIARTGIAEARI